jgi:hypothetical protein
MRRQVIFKVVGLPVVYISGPITLGDRHANVRQATQAFATLRRHGYAVICPHWSQLAEWAHPELVGGLPHSEWINNDLPLVERSDAVLRLPGESRGADEECEYALACGIPVYECILDLVNNLEVQDLEDLEVSPCTTVELDSSSPPEPCGMRVPVNHGWDS